MLWQGKIRASAFWGRKVYVRKMSSFFARDASDDSILAEYALYPRQTLYHFDFHRKLICKILKKTNGFEPGYIKYQFILS